MCAPRQLHTFLRACDQHRLCDAFRPPGVRRRSDDRRNAVAGGVARRRIDEMVIPASPMCPRAHPRRARDECTLGERVPECEPHIIERMLDRDLPCPGGRFATCAEIAAETDKRSARTTIDEAARQQIRGEALAEPTEIDPHVARYPDPRAV